MKQGIERQHQHSSNTMSSLYKWAQTVGMQPQHIITPALLALGIALMSGLSLGLLIPLAEGVSQGNFQLISTWPVLNWVLEIPIQFLTLNGLSNRSIFLIIVSVIVSAQLLKQLFSYIISVYISYHNGVWLYRMNSIIFQRYLKFGQQFYDNVSHGAIRTIIDYSREVINLLHKLHYAAIALAKITVQMFILCYISWQLTVIVVCFFPVFYFSVKRISRSIRLISIERSELRKSVGRELFNLLTSIPLIKIYGQEAEMSRRYDYSQQRVK